ncbi:hypothetical protein [Cupriavidus campinensis]|uniref:Dickkopf N-terminal cysteine-rich domain-containing protein n=1 Tax=Cupriavidus campinensis TaxID=151783 RepID=A0ABY3ERY0_9BURK|nr:hypothetical protein [Cupriavidus campinensis]TSP13716.1 hypothetical protein FGG12_04320 [Cupriavidus campinensis]
MTLRSLLFIASIGLAWASPAPAAGCQYDMQCKGERICQMGQCVSPDAEEAAEPAPKPPAAPAARATPAPAPAAAPRLCCTVAGKLKLAPGTDNGLAAGEACQGMTSSGKPVPGSVC